MKTVQEKTIDESIDNKINFCTETAAARRTYSNWVRRWSSTDTRFSTSEMEHEGRCVGNRVNAYTSDMDFHGGSKLSKLTYPIKTIYSKEARVQLRKVLDDFKPDVCHLNNLNYQLTPSIILEYREVAQWRPEEIVRLFSRHKD